MENLPAPPGLDVSPWQLYLNWLGFACGGYVYAVADARRLAGNDAVVEFVIRLLNAAQTVFEIARAYDLAEAALDLSVTHAIRDAATCLLLCHSLKYRATFVNILEIAWSPLTLHKKSVISCLRGNASRVGACSPGAAGMLDEGRD